MTPYFLKEKIRSGRAVIGMMMFSGSVPLVELAGHSGLDFVILDAEHSAVSEQHLSALILAARSADMAPLVRVRSASDPLIRVLLELGAEGIVVPHVQTAADAAAVVSQAKFPPVGDRGYAFVVRAARFGVAGNPARFMMSANDDTIVLLMAEDERFFENADAILSTPGIDGCFVGAADFAVSLGLAPGSDAAIEAVREAKERLSTALRLRGLWSVVPLGSRDGEFILADNDIAAFAGICRSIVARGTATVSGGTTDVAT